MKFDDIYNKTAILYIKEQDETQIDPSVMGETPQPEQVSDEISSAMPTPETVDLNEEKYKTLLLALKKALEAAAGDDLAKRKVISDIDIESDPKKAEEYLISLLDADTAEFPQKQE